MLAVVSICLMQVAMKLKVLIIACHIVQQSIIEHFRVKFLDVLEIGLIENVVRNTFLVRVRDSMACAVVLRVCSC